MLILLDWTPEKNGGLFLLPDGRRVFKSNVELEKNYLSFVHNSPKGEEFDQVVFVWKGHFS